MLKGFYTAASGMIASQRQQETLANNIANVNTPGYKADQATFRAFPELLMHAIGTHDVPTKRPLTLPTNYPIGALNTGVYVQETVPKFTQGDLTETGIHTDFAIYEEALPVETAGLFFTVQNDIGDVRFTRNGNFTVDGQGFLVTNHGHYVLDQTGNRIQTGGYEMTVNSAGVIDANNQSITLGMAYIEDANDLTKEGQDLFYGASDDIPAGVVFSIHQGHLERSNVDAVETMTQMMEAYRTFEINQQVLKAFDESLGKAVNEIGRIG